MGLEPCHWTILFLGEILHLIFGILYPFPFKKNSIRHNAIPRACELTLIHSGWYKMHFPFNWLSVKPVFMGAQWTRNNAHLAFFVPSVQQLKSTNSYPRVFGAIQINNRTSNLLNRDSWESHGLVLNEVTAAFKNEQTALWNNTFYDLIAWLFFIHWMLVPFWIPNSLGFINPSNNLILVQLYCRKSECLSEGWQMWDVKTLTVGAEIMLFVPSGLVLMAAVLVCNSRWTPNKPHESGKPLWPSPIVGFGTNCFKQPTILWPTEPKSCQLTQGLNKETLAPGDYQAWVPVFLFFSFHRLYTLQKLFWFIFDLYWSTYSPISHNN